MNARQIAKHGKRADSIVRGMMEHARPGDAEQFEVSMNGFVEEYVNLAWHGYRARFPELSVDIERKFSDSVGNAKVAPQEMGRVIINLVGNALDVVRDAEDGRISVSTSQRNGRLEIRVSDNGPGVPSHLRTKIFEPFFTTKPTGEGTGLGLSMSHDIVTKGHGGSLRVEETPGGGATFVVSLPV
jgi:C4-dicarboxylate-specific signal transduction histidine kinase